MDTALERDFADGSYRFWIGLPQAIEIERKCGTATAPKSLFTIYDELSGGLADSGGDLVYVGGGAAIVNDAREVVRLSLIGGNSGLVNGQQIEVGPLAAKALVDAYLFPSRPLIEAVQLAWLILHAAITGVSLKKKDSAVAQSESPNP